MLLRQKEVGELTQHKVKEWPFAEGGMDYYFCARAFHFENIETILSTVVIIHMCYVYYILQVASLMHRLPIVPAPCPNLVGFTWIIIA